MTCILKMFPNRTVAQKHNEFGKHKKNPVLIIHERWYLKTLQNDQILVPTCSKRSKSDFPTHLGHSPIQTANVC